MGPLMPPTRPDYGKLIEKGIYLAVEPLINKMEGNFSRKMIIDYVQRHGFEFQGEIYMERKYYERVLSRME